MALVNLKHVTPYTLHVLKACLILMNLKHDFSALKKE